MRFVSTYDAGVDDKRRVTVPADFRASLRHASARAGTEIDHIRVWQGEGPWLEASDDLFVAAFSEAAEEAAAEDPEAAGSLFLDVLGSSRKLALDGAGRVVLPEALAASAGLADRAVFVGLGPLFRIASPHTAAQMLDAARARSKPVRHAVMAAARLKLRGGGA